MKIEISIPFVYQASDYHEFGNIQRDLENLTGGVKLKYKELNSDKYGTYFAVFYIGKRPTERIIDKLYYKIPCRVTE